MTKNILYLITLSAIVVAIAFGCKGDEDKNLDASKMKQLENMVNNGVRPQISKCISSFEALEQKAETFNADKTEENFEALRVSFKEAMLSWKACEIYEMGDVKADYLYKSINFWPPDVNRIEAKISNATVIDEEFVKKLGSPLRSISAVEYLLYNSHDSAEVLDSFKKQDLRSDYLTEICKYLTVKINKIEESWDNYASKFVVPNNQNKLEDGQNIALNSIVQQLENVKNLKLGIPLGDKFGVIDYKKLEAYRSRLSLDIIKVNLTQVEKMLTGEYENSDNYGFDDYLSELKKDFLNDKTNSLISDVHNKLAEVESQPLQATILLDTQKVRDLQDAVTALLVFVKKHLTNATDAVITVSENDGD